MQQAQAQEQNRAEQNAQGWAENISDLHEAWQFCQGDLEGRDLSRGAKRILREHEHDGTNLHWVRESIEEECRESPLSVEVREGWHAPWASDGPEDFAVLLSTGGPALRLRGDLDQYCQPRRAWLEHQDWFKPWTQFFGGDSDALLWFAGLFWFGE